MSLYVTGSLVDHHIYSPTGRPIDDLVDARTTVGEILGIGSIDVIAGSYQLTGSVTAYSAKIIPSPEGGLLIHSGDFTNHEDSKILMQGKVHILDKYTSQHYASGPIRRSLPPQQKFDPNKGLYALIFGDVEDPDSIEGIHRIKQLIDQCLANDAGNWTQHHIKGH